MGRSDWPGPLDRVVALAGLDQTVPGMVLDTMVSRSILMEDAGLVSIGTVGEREYGRRNFMDVTSLFLTEPLLTVRWGQRQLGSVDPSSLASRDDGRATILLGGHAWGVRDVDWDRRLVWVEPADEPGRSRWNGGGASLSIDVCHAIRDVLVEPADLANATTARASAKLEELRGEHMWARASRTTLVRDDGRNRSRWWTFGGGRANRAIAATLDAAAVPTMSIDDLGIGLRTRTTASDMKEAASGATTAAIPSDPRRRSAVKFGSCLADEDSTACSLLAIRTCPESTPCWASLSTPPASSYRRSGSTIWYRRISTRKSALGAMNSALTLTRSHPGTRRVSRRFVDPARS